MAYPYTYQTSAYQNTYSPQPTYQNAYSPQPVYQNMACTPPVPDQLATLRQQNMQHPMMPQPLPQTVATVQPTQVDERIWVQGREAANSYLVAANGFVRLWDSTAPIFYEKQADAQGKPMPLRIFDYTERTAAPKNGPTVQPQAQYATVEQLNDLKNRLEALENKPCKCEAKKTEKKVKEEPADG